MGSTHTPTQAPHQNQGSVQDQVLQKLPFTTPKLTKLGNITRTTGDGGNASDYDSWDKHRS